MNYYEHHLGDYMRDTAHLSILEDGVYRRLLDAYYIKEAPIPTDAREACRLVRAQSKQERDAVQIVLREFFDEAADGWHHKRCDREIARFRDKQAKAKSSADARWSAHRSQSEGNANASPNAMRTHSEGNALQSPDTSNQIPNTSRRDGKPSASPADKAKAELWKAAVSLLSAQGMAEPQARSLFGKLSKDYPDGDIVLSAVQAAVSEQPADARAYLKATCQRLAGERKRDGATADWTANAL